MNINKSAIISIYLFLVNYSYCQDVPRVFLSGSRITIIQPKNVLIPTHTATIYMDSTIEFAFSELPNIASIENDLNSKFSLIYTTGIIEQFDIKVNGSTAKVVISSFNQEKRILQCYFGDSTYCVLAQCIYKNSMIEMKDRLLDIIKTVKMADTSIDWDSYLSFSYDKSNLFKPVDQKYVAGIQFTPNGVRNDSLFTQTNISCLQFPPAPTVKSSKDLMLAAIGGQLSEINILKYREDGQIMINQQLGYRFSAKCEKNGKAFELYAVAIYDPKSSLFFSCQIINDTSQNEVYNFISSINHKRDGY